MQVSELYYVYVQAKLGKYNLLTHEFVYDSVICDVDPTVCWQ